jgi:hypothetical protein
MSQLFDNQYGCPVCEKTDEDIQFWASKYSELIRSTPMFMNSPNHDKSDPSNNEA